jgi:pilus assembly protein CpaF
MHLFESRLKLSQPFREDAEKIDMSGVNQGNQVGSTDWKSESGPLRPLIMDPTISEIMVNNWQLIFVEKNGVIEESPIKFKDPDGLMRFVLAMAVYVGKELNRRTPCLDARLNDGFRLNIVVPPVALDGPSITIRKPSTQSKSYQDLVAAGHLDAKATYFLSQAVSAKQNIIVSGGTGSGKTTLLNVLSSFIRAKERVVTLEDTAELQLKVKNLIRLETKAAIGTDTNVGMDMLLRNALRMRPDRIVIGECRGAETWDMLMAMNTGHEGSMTTVHANTAADALRRLESMILRTGTDAPLPMIQADIASTVHFIIQTARNMDGKREITEIVEVCGRDETDYIVQHVFKMSSTGLQSTGYVPQFVMEQAQRPDSKVKFPADFFNPEKKISLAA